MVRWHADSARQIERRIVITGTLVLDTPAVFSNGELNGTELMILEDALERRPLLQGSSLAGALRHYLLRREIGYRAVDSSTQQAKTLARQLFGESLDDGADRSESRMIVADALGSGTLTRREGVKIDSKTRTADDHMLYSSQVWDAGTTFDLRFELLLYTGDSDNLIRACAAALQALGHGEIRLGGRKQRGYGRVHVTNWRVCHYDLCNPAELGAWLLDDLCAGHEQWFFEMADDVKDRREYLRIEALMQLHDSLHIRAASSVADNQHLTSKGEQPVLSGTSLAGALRARALKIAQTVIVPPEDAERLVGDLFGDHGGEKSSASRLLVEEHSIQNGDFDCIQNRIKIDRFTGGVFDGALFDDRPVFATDDTLIQVNLELQFPAAEESRDRIEAETGLLLLALKDLWTEDLPLGGQSGIGRGRVRGKSARITLKTKPDQQPAIIHLNEHGLTDSHYVDDLQSFVDALRNYRETQS